ncbi:MAG: hypothetical protein P4L50_07620 [Anaerolineaceae bacterium]|nr:hypothetical protein [Anaerolineaceae bacterium]
MQKKRINKNIQIIIISTVAVLGCLILSIFSIYNLYNPKRYVAPAKMVIYSSEYGHFSIKIPYSWSYIGPGSNAQKGLEDVSKIFNPVYPYLNPLVTIFERDFGTGNINDVINWGKARDQEFNGYEQLSMYPYNTEKYSGYINTYNVILGPPLAKSINECMDWFILNKQMGYSFQFCALKAYWPDVKDTFDEMINSIQINE